MKKNLAVLLGVIFILTLWQIAALQIAYSSLFPTLPDLFKQTLKLFISNEFYAAIFSTIIRGLIGFGIAFFTAFLLGTISLYSAFWKSFFHPLLIVIRSVPVISLVLISLLWFSPTLLPVFIAFLTMFPILYQNTLNGLESTDYRLVEMAKVFGKNRLQIFFHIHIPTAKVLIFSGISTAMGYGWRAIIIGEVLAQPLYGIGTKMKKAQSYIDISELIAWTVIAILISYLFDFIIKQLSKINFIKHFKLLSNTVIDTMIPNEECSINILNISKKYEAKIIYENFSLSLNSTEVNCLKATSGYGKTTLLNIIAGLVKVDAGKLDYKQNTSFAFAFQDFRLLSWLTVEENIAFVIKNKSNSVSSKLISYLINKLELTEHRKKYPLELSGGQQQRVSLARALAAETNILLLDEPLSGLDNELKLRIIAFLEEWLNTKKPLTVWATHENISFDKIDVREIYLEKN